MIQLHVVSGGASGKRQDERKFPVSVGRSANCTLAVTDPGVFDRHFEIEFSEDGFTLAPCPNAMVTVNGVPSGRALLRNGDLIGAGYAKIQFWLGALPQRTLRVREIFAWMLIISVAAAQVYFFYWLLAIAS